MFQVTHFRSEFIRQGQATIIRKVTMVQFTLMIGLTGVGIGLFDAPFWLAPLFLVLGYAAGYRHNGEIVIRRLAALALVRSRSLMGRPQRINLQAEWDAVRLQAESARVGRRATRASQPEVETR